MVHTMSVLRARNREFNVIRNVRGRVLSMMSMSAEKRLVIRPTGVVSKNAIGARRIFLSILWWSLPAAVTIPRDRMMAYRKTNTPAKIGHRRLYLIQTIPICFPFWGVCYIGFYKRHILILHVYVLLPSFTEFFKRIIWNFIQQLIAES